jgi:mitochondrial GTPase 1
MANKFPDQNVFFASWNKPKDIRVLSDLLVSMSLSLSSYPLFVRVLTLSSYLGIAKRNPYAVEMNVLVVGMPNVGKSTLLNALRNIGIPGRKSLKCHMQFSNATIQFEYV